MGLLAHCQPYGITLDVLQQTAFKGLDLPCGQGSRVASVVVLARPVCFLSSVGRALTLGLR